MIAPPANPPVGDAFEQPDPAPPMLRGWLHTLAFFVTIPAGVVVIVHADGTLARTTVCIYCAALLLSFGTSAAYHRLARTDRARRIMQRLDHSMIYVLIAGTYVPASLLGVPLRWGIPLLCVVAVGALVGVVLKLTAFHSAPTWLAYSLYPLIGWAAIVVLPTMIRHVDLPTLLLIVGGGVAYTLGFPVLLFRRPDPWPRVFGYHEVWHVFTVVAASMHFGAVVALAT